jgi:hypothetical protein
MQALSDIPLSLMEHQDAAFYDMDTPVILVSGGKGSGKSDVITCQKAYAKALLQPGCESIISSPTYGMTRRNLLGPLRNYATRMGLKTEGLFGNSAPQSIRVHCYDDVWSTIWLDVTIENYDRVNGMNLADVFIDEIDKARREQAALFVEECKFRLRKPYPGQMAQMHITGAPEYNGLLSDLHDSIPEDQHELFRWSMRQNYMLPEWYVQNILKSIPLSKQKGWIDGEFMYNTDGVVYQDFDPTLNAYDPTTDSNLPGFINGQLRLRSDDHVWVAWDINDGGCSVVLLVHRTMADRSLRTYIVGEKMKMLNTLDILRWVDKQPWKKQSILTCDPASTQVFGFIEEYAAKNPGVKVRIMEGAPEVEWRVNAVNLAWCNAKGERTMFIDKKAAPWVYKLTQQQRYEKGAPDKKTKIEAIGTDISGPLDSKGYGVFIVRPWWPSDRQGQIKLRGFGNSK